MGARLGVSLAALLVVASLAPAGTVRHDVPDAQYTGLAGQSQFDPVGRMNWTDSNGTFISSGTLITPQWMLTAGHTVDTTASSRTFTVGGSSYSASIAIAHPNWTGDLTAGFDIGLVRLDTPVTNVTPASVFGLALPSAFVGAVGTSVGFGATGTGLTGINAPAGTKRAGQNVVDGAGLIAGSTTYSGNILFSDFDNPDDPDDNLFTGSAVPLALEYLIAPGDSGGGLFFQDTNGDWAVGAVHSFGLAFDGNLDSDFGDAMGSTAISPHWEWIQETIQQTEASLAVPTPAAIVPGLVLVGLLVGRRRRAA